jgi:type II secretory pathway component PulF
LITIVVCQVLLAGLACLLYFVTRPTFAEAYKDWDGPIPSHALLALSSWYLPSLPIIAIVCDAAALLVKRRSVRNALLGLGLVLPAIGLAVAIDGIFVPLFQAAPAR